MAQFYLRNRSPTVGRIFEKDKTSSSENSEKYYNALIKRSEGRDIQSNKLDSFRDYFNEFCKENPDYEKIARETKGVVEHAGQIIYNHPEKMLDIVEGFYKILTRMNEQNILNDAFGKILLGYGHLSKKLGLLSGDKESLLKEIIKTKKVKDLESLSIWPLPQ